MLEWIAKNLKKAATGTHGKEAFPQRIRDKKDRENFLQSLEQKSRGYKTLKITSSFIYNSLALTAAQLIYNFLNSPNNCLNSANPHFSDLTTIDWQKCAKENIGENEKLAFTLMMVSIMAGAVVVNRISNKLNQTFFSSDQLAEILKQEIKELKDKDIEIYLGKNRETISTDIFNLERENRRPSHLPAAIGWAASIAAFYSIDHQAKYFVNGVIKAMTQFILERGAKKIFESLQEKKEKIFSESFLNDFSGEELEDLNNSIRSLMEKHHISGQKEIKEVFLNACFSTAILGLAHNFAVKPLLEKTPETNEILLNSVVKWAPILTGGQLLKEAIASLASQFCKNPSHQISAENQTEVEFDGIEMLGTKNDIDIEKSPLRTGPRNQGELSPNVYDFNEENLKIEIHIPGLGSPLAETTQSLVNKTFFAAISSNQGKEPDFNKIDESTSSSKVVPAVEVKNPLIGNVNPNQSGKKR